MTTTPEVEAEILAAYRQNPNRFSPFKVSSNLGVPIADVLEVVDRNREALTSVVEIHDGLGRPELRDFLVARKRGAGAQWDNDGPEVSQARTNYEAGTHEMCTGRDGPWQLLYSIPRVRPTTPRFGYFNPELS